MSTPKIDLNALMLNPNFDEYPDELTYADQKVGDLPTWIILSMIFVGVAIIGIASNKVYTSTNYDRHLTIQSSSTR
jgi:hypothetical protein